MDQPDYSKYSEAELRQILTHIDAERYPERVAEIEASLAAPRSVQPAPEVPPAPIVISSVWRRIGAFLLDTLVLCAIGLILGGFLHEAFSLLGPWAPLAGYVITVAYFGFTQSQWGGGRSLGMRIFGLKVISADGDMLGIAPAFIRAGIFCATYFLVRVFTSTSLTLLLYGVGFCITYLLIFNRHTRQSLHDLAVGAFVVKAGRGPLALPTKRIWRPHLVIAASAAAILCVGVRQMSLPLLSDQQYIAMGRVREAVSALPGVGAVSVAQSANNIAIYAIIDGSTPDCGALARRIARVALERYAETNRMRTVTVTLSSGYDIGIAQYWRSFNYAHTPQEWQTAGIQ